MKPAFTRLLCAGLLLIAAGCDGVSTDDEAPAVLPPAAFQMDTGLFSEQASKSADPAVTHFANAALRVWPVTAVVGAHLIVPAAVTAAALEAERPALVDGAWSWSSQTSAHSQNLRFTLSARTGSSFIDWSMRVAQLNPASGSVSDEIELYTARTDPNTRAGSWSLFYRLNGIHTNVLDADFTVHGETEREITFSVPTGEAEGDVVRYARDGSEITFYWKQERAGEEHLVVWDERTHAGSITATNYNGGARACWDSQLRNVSCE